MVWQVQPGAQTYYGHREVALGLMIWTKVVWRSGLLQGPGLWVADVQSLSMMCFGSPVLRGDQSCGLGG